jgi:hypothetical protein
MDGEDTILQTNYKDFSKQGQLKRLKLLKLRKFLRKKGTPAAET